MSEAVTSPVNFNSNELAGEDAVKDAARKAITDMFAITPAWGQDLNPKYVYDCPSGQKILLRRLSTIDLINANLMNQIDYFSKRLLPKGFDEAGNPIENADDDEDFWEVLKDNKRRCEFFRLLNKIVAMAVVKPKVVDDGVAIVKNEVVIGNPKIKPAEGEVLASRIDFPDKMAIFGELNKPLQELKPFRGE